MQSLTFVEIDVDRCSRTYGVAPCTASIPTTGDRKCMNAVGTCQDRANFNDTGVTIRFAIDASYLPDDIDCIPCLTQVDYSPSIVSLGVDLGQRASLKVVCKDHPDSDTGPHGDPYLADRDYNPFAQGTFFGKFRARHPYLRGRALRLIRGEVGQALADMETRHFIIDSFDGPMPDGSFTVTAKDVLKLADGDRAQAPRVSTGFLSADINSSTTSATLSPSGIGNAEYPASGHVAIGGTEVCAFTRSGDALTLTRGQLGTSGVAHSQEDRVQVVLRYASEDPADILADLLETYAGVPGTYIPLAQWLEETGAYLNRLYTATIAEPTSVSKLISEIIEQAALAVWWDDEAQLIRLQVLRGISTDATRLTEDNTIEGSLQTKEQPDKRVSQVDTYFAQSNPLKPVDDADNYRSIESTRDEQSEEDYGSAAIKKIYSRWIPAFGRTVATRLNQIILGRFKNPPRRVNLDLFRDGVNEVALGQGARVSSWCVQDDTGAASDIPVQVTRVHPEADRLRIEAEEMIFEVPDDFNDRNIIIDVTTVDINLRSVYDEIYPAPAAGDIVNCIVQSGAIVGSSSPSTPGFDVGSWLSQAATGNRTSGSPVIPGLNVNPIAAGWTAGMVVTGTGIPAGTRILSVDSTSQITLDKNATSGSSTSTALTVYTVIINLTVEGRLQGRGGKGGAGNTTGSGRHGGAGGDAFYTRYPIMLDGSGEIYGGGGGGGGGGPGFNNGGKGGGGAGWLVGSSGAGAGADNPGTTEAGGPGRGGGGSDSGDGGNGGGPATAGSNGSSGDAAGGGTGGAAGRAINGDSYIIESGSLTVLGARVN